MKSNRMDKRDFLARPSVSLVTLAASRNVTATIAGGEAPSPAASSAGGAGRARRMKWWPEARFGMFVHWGLYSVLGRHVMENEGIPVAEYEQLAKRFQPKPNAARAWAKLAKKPARNTWS